MGLDQLCATQPAKLNGPNGQQPLGQAPDSGPAATNKGFVQQYAPGLDTFDVEDTSTWVHGRGGGLGALEPNH